MKYAVYFLSATIASSVVAGCGFSASSSKPKEGELFPSRLLGSSGNSAAVARDALKYTPMGYTRPAMTTSNVGPGYLPQKADLQKRLSRVEGQVRGVARMVEEERYCIDILTQLSAVQTALEAVGLKVLDEHVRHCVTRALASGDAAEAETKADELLAAVRRFAKTR